MSELALVFAVIALTVFVLVGLLLVFAKWLRIRDQLDARSEAAAAGAALQGTSASPHRNGKM